MAKKQIDVTKHILVPEHIKLSEEEKKEILEKYGGDPSVFPKILITDPAIQHLKPKVGDMIKIIRKSPIKKNAIYYRIVVKS